MQVRNTSLSSLFLQQYISDNIFFVEDVSLIHFFLKWMFHVHAAQEQRDRNQTKPKQKKRHTTRGVTAPPTEDLMASFRAVFHGGWPESEAPAPLVPLFLPLRLGVPSALDSLVSRSRSSSSRATTLALSLRTSLHHHMYNFFFFFCIR